MPCLLKMNIRVEQPYAVLSNFTMTSCGSLMSHYVCARKVCSSNVTNQVHVISQSSYLEHALQLNTNAQKWISTVTDHIY